MQKPVLYVSTVLKWADAHHRKTGKWPTRDAGPIPEALDTTWAGVDLALRHGNRGFPGGSSLAQLLAENRSVRNRAALPKLSITQILAWCDAHREHTGDWPNTRSGAIADAPGETWLAVEKALENGSRGLRGESSLRRLLAQRRQVRNQARLPELSEEQILTWSDLHFKKNGAWPTRGDGLVEDAAGETWLGVSTALAQGHRGLPGGSSLAKLLEKHRQVRNRKHLSKLSARAIVRWAQAHRRRTGKLPSHRSGPIEEAPGETWGAVHSSLYSGTRGFEGGSSLHQVLRAHCQ